MNRNERNLAFPIVPDKVYYNPIVLEAQANEITSQAIKKSQESQGHYIKGFMSSSVGLIVNIISPGAALVFIPEAYRQVRKGNKLSKESKTLLEQSKELRNKAQENIV